MIDILDRKEKKMTPLSLSASERETMGNVNYKVAQLRA
jgi:hypothetical protein